MFSINHSLKCEFPLHIKITDAKLASDLQKPNGLGIIFDDKDAEKYIHPLDLDEVWGIGNRRYAKLKKQGLKTIQDGIERGYQVFQQQFGPYFGKIMWEQMAGKDRAKVLTESPPPPKLLNYMHTFSDWTKNSDRVAGEIMKGVYQLCYRMRGYNAKAHQYFCYLRVQSQEWSGPKFKFNTAGSTNLDDYVYRQCIKESTPILKRLLENDFAIRGIGIGTRKLDTPNQKELFFEEDPKTLQYYLAQDAINNEYGKGTIQKASMKYAVQGKTHFLGRS